MLVRQAQRSLFSVLSRYMGSTASDLVVSSVSTNIGIQPVPSIGAPGTLLRLRHSRGKTGFTPLTREEADGVRAGVLESFPEEGILCTSARTGTQLRVYRSGSGAGLGKIAYENEAQPLGALVTHGSGGRHGLSRSINHDEAQDLQLVD